MKIKTQSMTSLGLACLFLGTLFGSSIYIGHTALIPVRIGFFLAFLVFITQTNKITSSYQFNTLFTILFTLFTYQFLFGTLVSLTTDTLGVPSNIIKFIFLYMMLTLLILYGNMYKQYINILYKVSNFFMLILVAVSYYEIKTWNHFSFSAVYKMPSAFHFTPTAFYTNQNDFLTIITLLLIFNTLILIYSSSHQIKKVTTFDYYLFIGYLLYAIYLSGITSSRASLIVLTLLLFIIIQSYKKLIVKIIIYCLIIIGTLLFLMSFPDIIEKVISYNEVVTYYSGNSTNVRISLYKDALLNFTIFGEGANNSHLLYIRLNNPDNGIIINPHNYLLETLINNGIIYFTVYIFFNIYLIYKSILLKRYFLGLVFILYHFILISPSSSLFIWSQYIYYVGFISFLINLSSLPKPQRNNTI